MGATRLGWLVGLLALGGCGEAGRTPPTPSLWPAPRIERLDPGPLGALGWLAETSPWVSAGCGPGQPREARQMGDLAVGNGSVFALTGYACPLNTLHTMIGPSYQKEDAFFDDTSSALWAEDGGGAPAAEATVDGAMFRFRDGPLVVHRERSARLELVSITFAPLDDPAGSAAGAWAPQGPAARALVRVCLVRNLGGETVEGVELRTDAGDAVRQDRQRRLVALEPAGAATPESLPLGALAPGEVRRVALAYLLSQAGQGEDETLAALQAAGADALAADTAASWRAFLARAARVESPDPMLDDLWRGLLLAVKVQQAAPGGFSPMSEYSRLWTRDLIGPVRLLLGAGLHEEVRAALEYYHLAAAAEGDYANSFRLDVPAEPAPPEPDWAALPPFEGRTAAEGPSHVPWMARLYALASGDHTLAGRWFEFLRRGVTAQPRDARGLLGFSGDETYRPAMAVALDWDMQYAFETLSLSANSSFLLVVAAEGLAAEAEALGRPAADALALRALADQARADAEAAFWDEAGGYYLPFLDRVDAAIRPPPFEDVAAQPLWTGYLAPEAPRALTNLATAVQRLGRADGLWISPLGPSYDDFMGLGIHAGVYTGMAPAYALHSLAAVDHPTAEAAFQSMRWVPSPSGNLGEMQIADDHSALQLIYDASGQLGDYSARFRPWEGGITGEALLAFLAGPGLDADAGRVRLAPRLPSGWPGMAWRNLRLGQTRFDLEVEEQGGRRVTRITPAAGSLRVELALPLGQARVGAVRLGGRRLGADELGLRELFGLPRVVLPGAEASAAAPLEAVVEWEPVDPAAP
ncbi:MAG TPA: hypothetical protein PK668_11610 [Myxococcota bacterium]|nr:hypothetical protein [Myxococcota bacterium]HRY93186.1 hypothetical protein [Myxococcota bacterium]